MVFICIICNTRHMRVIYNLILLISFFFLITSVQAATKFNLVQPNSQVNRGDTIKFTITVDTQGESVASTSVGVAYNSSDLQFVGVEKGNTFTTVTGVPTSGSTAGTSNLIVSGTSSPGFNGTGDYAYVSFKIIATSAGSTQLCSLFTPQSTPTIIPPTSLPQTGSTTATLFPILIAVPIIIGALFVLFKINI